MLESSVHLKGLPLPGQYFVLKAMRLIFCANKEDILHPVVFAKNSVADTLFGEAVAKGRVGQFSLRVKVKSTFAVKEQNCILQRKKREK